MKLLRNEVLGQSEDGEDVPCESHKSKIIRKITGGIKPLVNETILRIEGENEEIILDEELEDEEDDSENVVATNFNSWLTDIAKDAKETLEFRDNGDRDNLMQNLQFSTFLLDLCKLLPLWSGICCKYFKGSELFASSGNVESYFKDVKLSHRDLIPCSVDLFVQANFDTTNGMIIDASQNYIEYVADNAGTTGFDTTNDEISDRTDAHKAGTTVFDKTNDENADHADAPFAGFHESSSFGTSSMVSSLVLSSLKPNHS